MGMSQSAVTLTDSSWDAEVLGSPLPVLVDFWGQHCPPCHAIAPVIEALAQEYQGRLKVGKLNVEENVDTAVRYQVRGIPMFLIIKNGRVVEQKIGAAGKSEFVKMIDRHVEAAMTA
jgi:thioredoxin 1